MAKSYRKTLGSLRRDSKGIRKSTRLNRCFVEQFEPRVLLDASSLLADPVGETNPHSLQIVDDSMTQELHVERQDLRDVEKTNISSGKHRQRTQTANLVTVTGENKQEGKSIDFTIELINRDQRTVTISYRIVDGSAKRGSDFKALQGVQTVTIPPGGVGGIQTYPITVKTTHDTSVEQDERFELQIVNVKNGDLNGTGFNVSYAYSTILNDDTGIEIAKQVIGYEDGPGQRMAFTMRATRPDALKFNNPISANAVVGKNGTATHGPDFIAATFPGVIQLDYQSPSFDHVVWAQPDKIIEGSEFFTIELTNFTGSIDLAQSTIEGRGLIKDGAAPTKKINKVALIGNGYQNEQSDIAVAITNLDGELDQDFSSDGIAVIDLGGKNDRADAAVVQDDGKIVVAGSTDAHNVESDVAIVRYNADGTLDTEFGDQGVVVIDLGGRDLVEDVALENDGGIVLSATSKDPLDGFLTPVLMKVNSNGGLESEFGRGGLTNVEFERTAIAGDIEVAQDGSVLLTGSTFDSSESFVYVAKYQQDGNLDPTFGDDGIALIDLGDSDLSAELMLASDAVFLSATVSVNGTFDTALVRMNLQGELDAEFGDGGIVIADIGGNEFTRAITIDSQSRITIAGVTNVDDPFLDSFLARFLEDGSPDFEFGDGGVSIDYSTGSGNVFELEIDSDNRPVSLSSNFDESLDIVLSRWGDFGEPEAINTVSKALSEFGFNLNSAVYIRGTDVEQLSTRIEDFAANVADAVAELMNTELYTPLGDSNEDGRFDSSDLIQVFAAGLYETGSPASFADGDWNYDGLFNTADLIHVFEASRFEQPSLLSESERESIQAVTRLSELALRNLDDEEFEIAEEAQTAAEIAFAELSQTFIATGAAQLIQFNSQTTFTDPTGNPITPEEAAKRDDGYNSTTPTRGLRGYAGPGGKLIVVDGGTQKDFMRKKGDGIKREKKEIRDANGELVHEVVNGFDATGKKTSTKTTTKNPENGEKRIVEQKFNGKKTTEIITTDQDKTGQKISEKTKSFNKDGKPIKEIEQRWDPKTGRSTGKWQSDIDPKTGKLIRRFPIK